MAGAGDREGMAAGFAIGIDAGWWWAAGQVGDGGGSLHCTLNYE